jgi:hypothetical protein
MRFAKILPVVAGAFLLAVPAHAVVIDIFSQGTAADPNEYNDFGGGPTNNVVITPVGAWAVPPDAGASWISYADTGAGGSSPSNSTVVTFTQLFTLPFHVNTGSVTVWADDTAEVFLDGVSVFPLNVNPQDSACLTGPIACQQNEGGLIDLSGLAAGNHTLAITAYQLHGDGFGVLYDGSVESVPEPGTLILLGAGIVALGARRRKRA